MTAPFVFKNVVEREREVEVPVLDKSGQPVKDKDGNVVKETKRFVEELLFRPYTDALTIMSAFENALSKKASRQQLAFGSIDFKRLLIIAVVVVGAWFVIKSFVLPAVSGPNNVIP